MQKLILHASKVKYTRQNYILWSTHPNGILCIYCIRLGNKNYSSTPNLLYLTALSQPFILSGSINEQWAASGERLRGKGRYGVCCR